MGEFIIFEAAQSIDIICEARYDYDKGERKQISLGLEGVKVYSILEGTV